MGQSALPSWDLVSRVKKDVKVIQGTRGEITWQFFFTYDTTAKLGFLQFFLYLFFPKSNLSFLSPFPHLSFYFLKLPVSLFAASALSLAPTFLLHTFTTCVLFPLIQEECSTVLGCLGWWLNRLAKLHPSCTDHPWIQRALIGISFWHRSCPFIIVTH